MKRGKIIEGIEPSVRCVQEIIAVDAAIRRYETNVAIPSVLSLSYGDDTIIAAE